MDYQYILILRILHIGAGVFWAGTAIFLAGFLLPAVQKSGPDGGKFMQVMATTNRFPMVMTIVSTVTILSGILLMWKLSAGFQSAWMGTRYGIWLSIGGMFALIAYVIGHSVSLPSTRKLTKVGMAVAAAGGPPSTEQMQQMAALRNKIASAAKIIAFLLFAAVISMGIARYV